MSDKCYDLNKRKNVNFTVLFSFGKQKKNLLPKQDIGTKKGNKFFFVPYETYVMSKTQSIALILCHRLSSIEEKNFFLKMNFCTRNILNEIN